MLSSCWQHPIKQNRESTHTDITLIVGAPPWPPPQSKTGLRVTNLKRLLNEGSTLGTGGTNADGASCNAGAECASGYCQATAPNTGSCQASCVPDGSVVLLGDVCSCCSGQGDGVDHGWGVEACCRDPLMTGNTVRQQQHNNATCSLSWF